MKNFWVRTASSVVYVILFVGAIYAAKLLHNELLGGLILTAFLLFVTIGGTFEFYRMMRLKGVEPIAWLGYLVGATVCIYQSLQTLYMDSSDFIAVLSTVMILSGVVVVLAVPVSVMLKLWGHSENPFADVAVTVLPALYIALPMGLMAVVNEFELLMIVVIMVWVNDACAYMGGSLMGKHKLWQRHSPGKTWEGCICGLVCCVLVGVYVGPFFNPRVPFYGWIVLSLICSVIGTLGDLAESMLKRSVGVKDSGNIMPGHGGFLDRFDSLLMIMPFVMIFSSLFL